MKELKNNHTISQLNIEKLINNKSNLVKEIDNRLVKKSKEKTVTKKVHNWAGLQIVKSLFGIPFIPIE